MLPIPTPRLRVEQGDITKMATTAIVNAETQFESIAFPGISTGIYGYPKPEAAAVAGREIRQWLAAHEWPREVVLVAFDQENKRLYEQVLAALAGI